MQRKCLISGILVLAAVLSAWGQTCCSGGVPVSSNLGFAAADQGTLQLSVATDVLLLRSLFAKDVRLADAGRQRTTTSLLFRAAYNPAARLTVETLLPYVRQSRTIERSVGADDVATTRGIGDGALLVIYDAVRAHPTIRLGTGVRIPLGDSDTRNDQGIFFVEDLQAGSGAWDGLLFASFEVAPSTRPSATTYLNAIYRVTGTNRESRGGTQAYRFGNELQLIAGYNDQYFTLGQLWNSGAGLRYRSVQRDAIDGFKNTGTGGRFLFVRLQHGIALGDHLLEANLELPLYRYVNETQLTPTVAFGLGWYTQINFSKPQRIFMQ